MLARTNFFHPCYFIHKFTISHILTFSPKRLTLLSPFKFHLIAPKIRDLRGSPKPDYHPDSDGVGVGVTSKEIFGVGIGVTSKEIFGVGIGVNSKEIFGVGVGVGFAGKIFSESESKLLPTPIKFRFFLNQ
jgi:hypothetical protein